MFATVVIGVVLVSFLSCEGRRQQFFEVPFDDSPSTQTSHQFTSPAPHFHNGFVGTTLDQKAHIAPNQHFVTNQQQFQQNSNSQVLRNNNQNINRVVANSRLQSAASQEEVLRNAVLRAQLEEAGRTAFHGHLDSDSPPINQVSASARRVPVQGVPETHLNPRVLPPSNSFTRRPVQSFDFGDVSPPLPIQRQLSHTSVNTASHARQLDATPPFASSGLSDYQQLNSGAALRTSNPQVNTFFGVEEPTLRNVEHQAAVPQKSFNDGVNPAHFIQRVQPAVRAPISPPSQQIFRSQIPQQPQEVNSRFSERPEFLINVQPTATTPTRGFVNQRAPATPEVFRRPNSNIDRPTLSEQERQEEIFKQQAQSAKYSFASQIDDSINGNQHQREEVRDGLNVKGMYSYSDGYVKRTVFYEADDKGYRVVKQEEEPLGNGPQINPKGQANVSSYVAGNALQYSITSDDIQQISESEAQQRHQI